MVFIDKRQKEQGQDHVVCGRELQISVPQVFPRNRQQNEVGFDVQQGDVLRQYIPKFFCISVASVLFAACQNILNLMPWFSFVIKS